MRKQLHSVHSRHLSNKGFFAASSAMIIAVVLITLAVSMAVVGTNELQLQLAYDTSTRYHYSAEGCMEDALLKLQTNSSYAGGTLTSTEGSCSVSVSSSGMQYTVTVTTTLTDYRKRIVAVVDRTSSGVTLISWTEQ